MKNQTQDTQLNQQEFQAQLEEAQAARLQAEEAHKRALADYHNLQQRTQQERQIWMERASAELLADLLPTLDHLELALKHFSDPSLKMVASELLKTLERHGLERLPTVGQPFDPNTMEAIDTAAGEKDQVISEQRSGYRLGKSVLRHASVVVGTGASTQ